MTDDGPTAVAALPGDPASWPATVRDCLRYVRTESPAPAELAEWWAAEVEGPSGDDPEAAVERRLASLESADLLDRRSSPVELGRHGREYLDSHDETVLYEGIAAATTGLETVLEALAIRPLTDVEVADLLAAERDRASVPDGTARTHRQWLQALGFLERDDGVNELTRRGRGVVEAAGGPAPPGGSPADGDSPSEGNSGAGGEVTDGEGGASEVDGEGGVPEDGRATDVGPPSGGAPTGGLAERRRTGGRDERRRTDGTYVRELQSLYDDTCALCGDRRRADGEGVSRVHHLMPPGDPHDGPERPENAVVVCPNHRADLERGTVTVDPRTLEIEHAYEPEVTGRTLTTTDDHEPGAQYLAYHDAVIADLSD